MRGDVQTVSEDMSVDGPDDDGSSSEQDFWSAVKQPIYQGPMLLSRTRAQSVLRGFT